MIENQTQEIILESFKNYLKNDDIQKKYDELNENREEVLQNNIIPLINNFLNYKVKIDEFKTKNDSLNKKYSLWGFKGLAGAMFFNQLFNAEKDRNKLGNSLRNFILKPSNGDSVRLKIDHFSEYVKAVGENVEHHYKSPAPKASIFFLSYFWHMQSPNEYPIFYPKSRKALKSLGLFDENGRDDYGKLYLEFIDINNKIFKLLKDKSEKELTYDIIENFLAWYADKTKKEEFWTCPKETCENLEIELLRNEKNVIDSNTYKNIIIHFLQHLKNDNIYFSSQDIYDIFLEYSSENVLSKEETQLYPSRNIIWTNQIRSALGTLTREGYLETDDLEEIPEIYNIGVLEKKKLRTRKRSEKFFEEYETYDDWELYLLEKKEKEVDIIEQVPKETTYIFPKRDLLNKNLFESSEIEIVKQLLLKYKQIILYGPPGTSKTFLARIIAQELTDNKYEIIQFHPSYAYEDFIEWIEAIPSEDANNVIYKPNSRIFRELCDFANKNSDKRVILIIDEINRGDLGRIFGELILCLEPSYRNVEIKTPLSNMLGNLKVPDNLFLIGTMNSVDRSIAIMDYALRRRFLFYLIMPDRDILRKFLEENRESITGELKEKILNLFDNLNKRIITEKKLGKHYQIGHTYFFVKSEEELKTNWNYMIKPLIEEYFSYNEDDIKDYSYENLIKSQ